MLHYQGQQTNDLIIREMLEFSILQKTQTFFCLLHFLLNATDLSYWQISGLVHQENKLAGL